MNCQTHAIKFNYVYDKLGRLTSVEPRDGQVIFYAYDAAGNQISVIVKGEAAPAPAPQVQSQPAQSQPAQSQPAQSQPAQAQPALAERHPAEQFLEGATVIKPRAWLLKLTSGPSKDKLIPLAERLTIGRSAENDLVIADSLLSRNHAVIERAGGGYQVSDLGSGNGTLVNGVLIGKPTRLKPGDVVQIGDTRITVLGPDGTAPLPLDESTQMKPAPAATQVQVRAAARSTQAIPAPVPAARLCPHCGAPLKPTSKFCRNCGKVSAPGVAEAAPLRPPPAAAPALTCPNCGEPVRPGVKFCRKCGTTL